MANKKHLGIWQKFRQESEVLSGQIINWRRHFHRYPELAFQEKATSQKIQKTLKKMKIPFEVCAKTGIVATLDGEKPGCCAGLRADMDALPVQEETELPFASRHPGCMHACGHDGHMATALGVAAILARNRRHLFGSIRFIFQPAEEKPPGGAREVIRSGLIDDVDALIGFHYFPDLAPGNYWVGAGPVMAATDQFTIVVTGQGGHGSAPHLTSDPIVCAGFLISQVQTIVSRRIDPLASAVVSFGSIHGGEAFNIIPDRVQLSGTVRSFDGRVRKTIISSLKKICQAAAAFNCSARLNFQTYCPATVNQPALSKKVRALSEKILGKSALTAYHPVMGGEDFAFMAEKLSACYIFAGIGSSSGNNHSSTFNLNESVLAPTAYYLACLLYELARVRKK